MAIGAGAGVAGGIQQADAVGEVEKKNKAAAAKALKDATALAAQQKAEREQKAQLSKAFSGLATLRSGNPAGVYTNRLGLAGS